MPARRVAICLVTPALLLATLGGTAATTATATAAATAPDAAPAYSGSYSVAGSPNAPFKPGNNNLFPNGADDLVVKLSTTSANPVYRMPFRVRIYNQLRNQMWVSSNGNIQFSKPPSAAFTNTALPTASLKSPTLAVYWDDLLWDNSGVPPNGGGVYTRTYGSAPNRQFVVAWRSRLFATPDIRVRAEVIFFENSPKIEMRYADDNGGTNVGNASSATVGVQRNQFGPATQWSFNTSSVFHGLKLVYTPIPS